MILTVNNFLSVCHQFCQTSGSGENVKDSVTKEDKSMLIEPLNKKYNIFSPKSINNLAVNSLQLHSIPVTII